jgi:hypothetical protein
MSFEIEYADEGEHFDGSMILGDEPACRVCGCTQTTPCAGGCIWAAEDLCSACARAHGADGE